MLSRIADSLYWMNRYMERTEGILRILRTHYVLSLDKGQYGVNSWKPVVKLFSTRADPEAAEFEYNSLHTINHILLNAENNNSIKVILGRARENARGAQDIITKEVWEQINHLFHTINNPILVQRFTGTDPLAALDQLLDSALLFSGVTDSTMPRNMGWNFMNLGKFIERCLITVELSDMNFEEGDYNLSVNRDILFWRSLLFSLSGYELHLKTYRSSNYTNSVANQVIFNKQFTHSLVYCADRIRYYLYKIIEDNRPEGADHLLKHFGRLHSYIAFADMETVKQEGLKEFFARIRQDLLQLNRNLGQQFFSYS